MRSGLRAPRRPARRFAVVAEVNRRRTRHPEFAEPLFGDEGGAKGSLRPLPRIPRVRAGIVTVPQIDPSLGASGGPYREFDGTRLSGPASPEIVRVSGI